jgi:hypothetical protein
MKINCLSCGHSIYLDDAYDDFEGPVKCYVCSALLEIKTVEGQLKAIRIMTMPGQSVAPTVTINVEEYLKKGSAV